MQHNEIHSVAEDVFPFHVEKNFKSLGTDISIDIIVRNEQERERALIDLDSLPAFYERFMRVFNRFDPDSELSRLNGNIGSEQPVSDEMSGVAQRALEYWERTGGVYDPRILSALESAGYVKDFHGGTFDPRQGGYDGIFSNPLSDDLRVGNGAAYFCVKMDFAGIVKGYVTDEVKKFLVQKGWKDFVVDSGGDMYMAGNELSGSPWRISIEGISSQSIMFSLSEKAIATSGISRRKWEVAGKPYHHLINPKKPEAFEFSLKSVTVIADTTEEADVWAKVLFLRGIDEGILFAKENNIAAIFLPYRGGARISSRCREFLWTNS